jgi:hypothetical protein
LRRQKVICPARYSLEGVRAEGQLEAARAEGQLEGVRAEGQLEAARAEGQLKAVRWPDWAEPAECAHPPG